MPRAFDQEHEHCLLAIVGLSPGVLTETIFSLCTNRTSDVPDRIVVITTAQGREIVERTLFAKGGWTQLLEELNSRGISTAGRLRFGPVDDCIRVIPSLDRSRPLDDIQTAEDNMAAADFFMETVRALVANDTLRLTASLAGGRKSMSALLLSVMTLLGRFGDRLVHILVDPPWEQQPEFLFPGCKGSFLDRRGELMDSALAQLTLADIPFVPLRYAFEREIGRGAGSYQKIVQSLRYSVAECSEALEIHFDCDDGGLRVNDEHILLPPAEFALLGAAASCAKDNHSALAAFADLEAPWSDFIRKHLRNDDFGHWTQRLREDPIDPKEDFRRLFSSLRTRLRDAGLSNFQIDRIVPKRGRVSVDLPPTHINFTSR